MKRTAGGLVLLAALMSGCVTPGDPGFGPSGPQVGCYGAGSTTRNVPGVQGPWGTPVAMAAPYSSQPESLGADAARAMLASSVPLDLVQPHGNMGPHTPMGGMPSDGLVQAGASGMPGMGSGVMQAGGMPVSTPPGTLMPPNAITPPGVPLAPGAIQPVNYQKIPGAVAAVGAITGPMPGRSAVQRTEVRFSSPAGMKITWATGAPGCATVFPGSQLEAPGRYNFMQGAIYRLKLTEIPNRPGLELYPTLEVVPSTPRTDAFLAHSSVPVAFTEDDFEQVAAGNYVVKVIYLPDPQFQDLATGGPDEVVSSRLEPGVDPVAEAHRRGCILLIIRMGNIDLEAPNTPAMDAPSANCFAGRPGGPMPNMPPGMMGGMAPGMQGPGPMMPYGAMGPGGPMMGQGGAMMGQGGPMMGQGGPMMGPNGPMMMPNGAMMGPNGPMMRPSGPMMGNPGMPMMPSGQGMPGMPTGNAAPQQSMPPAKPVTMLPDKPEVQSTQYPSPNSGGVTPAYSPNPNPPPAAVTGSMPKSLSAATMNVPPPSPPPASPPPASSSASNKGWVWFGMKKDDSNKNAQPAAPAKVESKPTDKPSDKPAIQPMQYQAPSPTSQAPATTPAPVVHHEEVSTPAGSHSSANKGWVWFGMKKGNGGSCDNCKDAGCEHAAPVTTSVTEVKQPATGSTAPSASAPCEGDDKCACDKRWKIFENPFKPNPPATPLRDQKDSCTPVNATP